MIILPQKITVKWNKCNKKYYEQLGYIFTKTGNEFEVNANDLTKGSHAIVQVKCDYCGTIIKEPYQRYYYVHNCDNPKDCCKKCSVKKLEENNLKKYGVKYVTQTENMKEKSKKTILERYDVECITQSESMKEKSKKTCLERFGVENASQSDIIKKKKEKTCLEHFGVKYPIQNKDIQNQIEETNLKKYGFKMPSQNSEVIKKMHDSLYKNNTGPCSSQQKYIFNLLNINNEYELNYPVDNLMLDIVDIHNKIDIEYNGGGHNLSVITGKLTQNEFNIKEIKRQYYLKSQGWKLIRIKCDNDKLPNDEEIIKQINECKNYLVETNHTWINIEWN